MARPKIVLADDEPGNQTVVAEALGRDTYDILEAADGDEALRLIREFHPPVALIDVVTPGTDGREVCATVREDPTLASTCLLILTALGGLRDRMLGTQAGADEYWTKPFEPDRLRERVQELVAEEWAAIGGPDEPTE